MVLRLFLVLDLELLGHVTCDVIILTGSVPEPAFSHYLQPVEICILYTFTQFPS